MTVWIGLSNLASLPGLQHIPNSCNLHENNLDAAKDTPSRTNSLTDVIKVEDSVFKALETYIEVINNVDSATNEGVIAASDYLIMIQEQYWIKMLSGPWLGKE